jgi:hypothetical protein
MNGGTDQPCTPFLFWLHGWEIGPLGVIPMDSDVRSIAARPSPLPGLAAVAQGRDTLKTTEAAALINRAPQTLRKWACLECGPIRPVRINGRLAWRVADLEALLLGEKVPK